MVREQLIMQQLLTIRQEECFCLYSQNYSAKQAGKLLGKEPEAVRGLYKAAKNRLNLHSGFTDVDFIRNHGLRAYAAARVSKLELTYNI